MTPLGVVRYGAAILTVRVDAAALTVRAASGVAYVLAANEARIKSRSDAGSSPEPDWMRVDGPGELRLEAPADAAKAARNALAKCDHASSEARASAVAIARAASPSGAAASKNVVDRHRARGECGIARVRAELLPDSADKTALFDALKLADERWHKLGD
jgi:hypothetical protein